MQKPIKEKPIRPVQKWIQVIFGIIILMCLGTVYSWSVFRVPIEKVYNIGTTQSGLPYAVSLVFYALFMFFTGKYLEKYSPRLIILVGGFIVGAGWVLSSYVQNIYVLTITYGVIIGSGVGIIYGAPIAVAAKWFPENKGLVVGLVLIGFGMSPFITAPVARYLVDTYGLMPTFKILGAAFIVIISLLSYPFRYPSETENMHLEKNSDSASNKINLNKSQMIKTESFKRLYFNFAIGTTIGLMLIGLTGNVGAGLINLSAKKIAFFMSLFAVFNGLGRPVFGWLTDKLDQKKAMLISFGLIMIAAFLMLMAKEGSVVIYIVAFSIFWFNLGGWLAIAPASTLSMYGTKYYSQNYGVVFTAYGIGAVIGVLGSGFLKDLFENYNFVFYFVIALCSAGIFSSQKVNLDAIEIEQYASQEIAQ